MFELSVACKYLIPRWRQLSVSIISLVSTFVIALVVWLIVVFFSVKDGLENSWIDKIVALTAPVRITPTERYYDSYYYLADGISSHSDYAAKSIGEKLQASHADPYDPEIDEEIPANWPKPDRDAQGAVKDIARMAYQLALDMRGVKNLRVTDYETTMAKLRLRLLRHGLGTNTPSQQFLENAAYVGTFDADVPTLAAALIAPGGADYHNLLHMQSIANDNVQEDEPNKVNHLQADDLRERLNAYFSAVEIKALRTPSTSWRIPVKLLPQNAHFVGAAMLREGSIIRIVIPQKTSELSLLIDRLQTEKIHAVPVEIKIQNGEMAASIANAGFAPLSGRVALVVDGEMLIPATLDAASLKKINAIGDIRFNVKGTLQGYPLDGTLPLGRLEIADAAPIPSAHNSLYARAEDRRLVLPIDSSLGEAVILPKVFKETGALIGDHGYLSYYSPTPSTVQEQRIPIFISGFYDPGIMPIGGKYILASKDLAALIRTSNNHEEALISNGFNVRFNNLDEAPRIKAELLKVFEEAGIAPYWHIETFQEYEFTKDLIQQLHSEKNLFSLISLIIIIVACSNIISMLIILVNDKKIEIGILRSMGATSASIATIFGVCGMVMGAAGSIIGIVAAVFTLRYVNELVAFISSVQGYDLFNPVFYGTTLPSELSMEALTFVIFTTAGISLLAGIVPALKASMLRPSAILRAE